MHHSNLFIVGLAGLLCTIKTTTANGEHDVVKRDYTTIHGGGCTLICKDDDSDDCTIDCPPGVSLVTDMAETTANGEHDVVKRSFTTIHGGCTAVCKNNLFDDCTVDCSAQATLEPQLDKDPPRTIVNKNGWTSVCEDRWHEMIGKCSSHYTPTSTAKPALARRVHPDTTWTSQEEHGCQDICSWKDNNLECFPTCIYGYGIPTAKPALQKRAVVTVTNGGCTAVCWDKMPGTECDVQCSGGFATKMPLPTSKPSFQPDVQKRGFTATKDDCTAVCWDMVPGTGCDVQCHDTALTTMPASTSGVSSKWTSTYTTDDCTVICRDLNPGSECGFRCSGPLPTQEPVLAKANRVPVIEPREDIQARKARDVRLARKFGFEARDATTPQQSDISQAAAALSAASAALAQAVTATSAGSSIPPAASAALSEAASFLSSVSQAAVQTTTPLSSTASPSSKSIVPATPGSSRTAPTVSPTTVASTTVTTTAAASTTASITASTTASIMVTTTASNTEVITKDVLSPPARTIPSFFDGSDASARSVNPWSLVLVWLIGIGGNAALMI